MLIHALGSAFRAPEAAPTFSPMLHILTVPIVLIILAGCASNPYTNRSQLLLISENQEVRMGDTAYDDVLKDPNVVISRNRAEVEPVMRVAERIIAAAKQSKYAKRAQSFDWDVSVIKDDATKNAWALPGGKIAIYTGIFPEAFTEGGLAAIMGHEVVHALARHGAERVSQQTIADVGLQVASTALALGPLADQVAKQALGIGVLLPFGRSHESEADRIGMLLAAEAGYDPREAVRVWERMARTSKDAPPEFLSTHPAHDTRIRDLTRWMPQALAIYERSQKAPVSLLPRIVPP